MNDIDLIDSGFDKKDTVFYRLSIQLALNGFSFCVVDSRNNNILILKQKLIDSVVLESITADYYCQYLYDFIINESILKLKFKSLNIVYISKQSTLVPVPVYEKEGVNSIFSSNMKKVEEEVVLSNKINLFDAYSVFSIPDCINRVLSRQFINFNLVHQSDSLIQCAIKNSATESEVILYLNCNYNVIDIIVINQVAAGSNKLLFYNSYIYKNDDDIVYYLVNISEQLKTVNKIKEVVVSGNIDYDGTLHKKIVSFFERVSFIDISKRFTFSENFKDISLHNYLTLLNSALCE